MKERGARIGDVAVLAGVGVGTVSRVLNGGTGVRASTRQKVLRAIQELGYHADERGRALRAKRGNLILVLVPFFTRNLYVEMLRAIDRATPPDSGYILTVMNVESPQEKERAFALASSDTRLAGIISVSLTPPDGFAAARRTDVPLIVLDAPSEEFPAIEFDHVYGGRLGTNHLLGLGHRRIGFIGRSQDPFVRSGLRAVGYRQALVEAGVAWREEYVRVGEYSREHGLRDALALLDLPEPPTAIFAASDLQAIGVLEAARLRGLEVPDDLAVLGYNDVELAEYVGLSTVRLPRDELARYAMEFLEASWAGALARPPSPLRPTLIVRRSCGAASDGG